jgi:hypothetical protein
MLHEHDAHARIERQMFQERREGSSPPADAPLPTIGNEARARGCAST